MDPTYLIDCPTFFVLGAPLAVFPGSANVLIDLLEAGVT
jgi:hypothetical protein